MSNTVGTAKFVGSNTDSYKPVIATITIVLRELTDEQSPAGPYLKSIAESIVDEIGELENDDASNGALVSDMSIVSAKVEVKFQD